jgi:outer membrane protein OmpA-like peptidoglycan-associated protein
MKKRNVTLGAAISLSVLMAGCASTPDQNAKVDEAKAAYEGISQDPNVARSGDRQLRSAREELSRAEQLLREGADTVLVEHTAYLANQHARIAAEQGKRAALQQQISSAENRRRDLELQMQAREADAARQEAEALRQQMQAMQAEQTDRGMVLTLGDVLFDLNRAELKPSGETTVARLAEFMAEYENRRVRVEGYTDSTGEASYNLGLSERRAEAVGNALVNMGISPNRVDIKGFGERYPVASNDTSAGRQQNRRVEIVISDSEGTVDSR